MFKYDEEDPKGGGVIVRGSDEFVLARFLVADDDRVNDRLEGGEDSGFEFEVYLGDE